MKKILGFFYRDRIAAFIGVIKPGWGGGNIRVMAVTGRYMDAAEQESYDAP